MATGLPTIVCVPFLTFVKLLPFRLQLSVKVDRSVVVE